MVRRTVAAVSFRTIRPGMSTLFGENCRSWGDRETNALQTDSAGVLPVNAPQQRLNRPAGISQMRKWSKSVARLLLFQRFSRNCRKTTSNSPSRTFRLRWEVQRRFTTARIYFSATPNHRMCQNSQWQSLGLNPRSCLRASGLVWGCGCFAAGGPYVCGLAG